MTAVENTKNYSEPLAKYYTEVRQSETTFWKLLMTIAGGALTLSIGFLLKDSNLPFPRSLIPEVRCAWIALALCLVSGVVASALSFWGMTRQAKIFEDYLTGKQPYRKLKSIEITGWLLLLVAVASAAIGLIQLGRIALELLALRST